MLKDSVSGRVRLVRDHSEALIQYKNQKCALIQDQDMYGNYILEPDSLGEEEGWVQHPRFNGKPPAWAHATPALLDETSNRVYIMKDKTQAIDPSFQPKTASVTAGDSKSEIRIATKTDEFTPGIIVTCLNDGAREMIFFPIGGSDSAMLAIRDDGDEFGTPVTYNSDGGGWQESGVKKRLTMADPTGWYAGAFKYGNIYVGVDLGDKYLVSRYGFGPYAKTFTCNINGHILSIDVDGQGSVLGVYVT